VSAVWTYVVSASAMITAGSAFSAARYLRSIKSKVDANERRSKRNKRLLDGQNTPHDGLVETVDRIENRGDHS
jgi:hypothetical protein